MRWPNDVLIGNRKLAGLLIDQFAPELAVAGIGVNLRNSPKRAMPASKTRRRGSPTCSPTALAGNPH